MTSTSHAYTALLSTLHERSSLLSSPGSATIPPSLHRTLKRQLDTFARSIGVVNRAERRDIRLKWDRIQEALQGDEEGRKVLLSVRDGHPDLFLFNSEEDQASHGAGAASDSPYRDEVYDSRRSEDHTDNIPDDTSTLFASQQQTMSNQDRQLDTLSGSISRQHHLSLQMNEELELQSEILDDLDGDVERTGLRLGRASGQLDKVKRGLKDHASLFSLFMLIMLLIALIIIFK